MARSEYFPNVRKTDELEAMSRRLTEATGIESWAGLVQFAFATTLAHLGQSPDLLTAAVWLYQHPHAPTSHDGKDVTWHATRKAHLETLRSAGLL